ncbi:GGDEF domain-containing protein [Novosphingobium flavum]|uniref:diguanylate cyclase n=1 Tax=Novosphingobium flavum TaxID=1778672 RepID=A0A7X1KMD4_9SPHN|nr:GGDEF domain-containing protein [Novosphingobium flavum]MBC2666507.1 GGDEF domain-containing protein [Novosphingobium flavum]
MFKFLARSVGAQDDIDHPEAEDLTAGPGRTARRVLLDRMSEFLIGNDLDVSPANLLLAHAAFSGSDLDLARRIAERELAREAIDQDWLDRMKPAEADEMGSEEREAELDRLMGRLDSSLASFSSATTRAHGTTAAYGDSLQQHVGEMGGNRIGGDDTTGEMLTSLVGIAKAMLERTREVEGEMKRSSEEAESLRRSLERARRDAEIDHLTGLPNRRAFEGVLANQYREAQQEIDLLTLAICDIDHFKRVNDLHGHETGDRVIQAIGQVLARISDDRCHVARHGGEEFVMLFRGRSVREAKEMLDLARRQLADRNFINRITDEPIGQITFSGGVADVFAYADPRDALRGADEALYRAKAEGRNQIVGAERQK